MFDCIIIGGGPAGLNAALVLGRAKRKVLLLDENKPRNAVTHASHGFLTRDGIKPSAFKEAAYADLRKYPNIEWAQVRVGTMTKEQGGFSVQTETKETYHARKILLATGLKDQLPDIAGIESFYGSSLFPCPFCDGWELRDRPLVVICEDERVLHLGKLIWNWSKDLVICTNGQRFLTDEQKTAFLANGIKVIEKEIAALEGEDGQLQNIRFADGQEINREGGFVAVDLQQAEAFGKALGCTYNEQGGIKTDPFGRTSVAGVYASGDTTFNGPQQLILAAAEGSKVGAGIVIDLVDEEF
ncbi:NAD(P)/FAD-dependent oxidoreductase [Shouchella clausii]|jgi:thioredoxin reductase|nr:NAD(P)/FAD-dependent oxidoreductase [Shouchella clausii]MCM3548175.1 NAD(P)/FAD-dependent oxidoreductase [Shouchella clausii]MEB5481623.1 NAD(P)/FAD-dependent oxidoreductase [Shouchella clausii]PAD12013.1 pyridine nucleotide-disulfide oxidoreductase [Shouchella clausii]PAF13354.1 pyridine nucleotide-disulfide oxidoreductase [Shouchella clausii]